jgi:hypothetical protein
VGDIWRDDVFDVGLGIAKRLQPGEDGSERQYLYLDSEYLHIHTCTVEFCNMAFVGLRHQYTCLAVKQYDLDTEYTEWLPCRYAWERATLGFSIRVSSMDECCTMRSTGKH